MRKILLFSVSVAFVMLFSSCGYNKMTELNEGVKSSWAQVENVYQRRADLIPNLVNTVKGYASHEQATLTGVVEARSKATSTNIDANNLNPESIEKFQQAQDGLSSALSKLMVVVERYPDLKANQNFSDLQAQLEGTENRITVERKNFNDATKLYNTYIKKFPQVVYAGWFNFDELPYFKAAEGSDKAPEVQF
ncbi:MAG: LemA family protein [Bacteroidales bacterium]